jgi:hypothetical protein
VEKNQDGTIWSGTWVVNVDHARRALEKGSYVALHVTKSSPSYLQGIVKCWRRNKRKDPASKIKCGIDFLLHELNDVPVAWRGEGTGEKGYYYGDDEEPPLEG